MSFTLEDLRNAIEVSEDDDFSSSEFYFEVRYGEYEIPGIGKAGHVDGFGGMGQGDDLWVVFKIEGDDRLFRKSGYYSSYDGGEYDGALEQVEPYEKLVTFYRRVN